MAEQSGSNATSRVRARLVRFGGPRPGLNRVLDPLLRTVRGAGYLLRPADA